MEMKRNQTIFHGTCSNLKRYLFLSKSIKAFQWLSKWKLLSFKTKANTNNGNERKSDIFPWSIFKLTQYLLSSRNMKRFQLLSESKFLSFMTEVNLNNGNETKSDIFPWDFVKSDTISFFYEKIWKYFNDFEIWNFSVL